LRQLAGSAIEQLKREEKHSVSWRRGWRRHRLIESRRRAASMSWLARWLKAKENSGGEKRRS